MSKEHHRMLLLYHRLDTLRPKQAWLACWRLVLRFWGTVANADAASRRIVLHKVCWTGIKTLPLVQKLEWVAADSAIKRWIREGACWWNSSTTLSTVLMASFAGIISNNESFGRNAFVLLHATPIFTEQVSQSCITNLTLSILAFLTSLWALLADVQVHPISWWAKAIDDAFALVFKKQHSRFWATRLAKCPVHCLASCTWSLAWQTGLQPRETSCHDVLKLRIFKCSIFKAQAKWSPEAWLLWIQQIEQSV